MEKDLVFQYIKETRNVGFPKDTLVYGILGPIIKKFICYDFYDFYGAVVCKLEKEYDDWFIEYFIDREFIPKPNVEQAHYLDEFTKSINKNKRLKKYMTIIDLYLDMPFDYTRNADVLKIKLQNINTIEDIKYLDTLSKLIRRN